MSHWRAIFLLLTSAVSSVFGQEPEPDEREGRAIAAVERLGGKTYRENHSPDRTVNHVDLYQPVTDADLEVLTGFPSLTSLRVYRGQITDAGLARLAALPRLQHLWIRDSPITDAGADALGRAPQLRSADLIGTEITDTGTARLKELLPYALIRVRPDEDSGYHPERAISRFTVLAMLILLFGALWAKQIARSSWPFALRHGWLRKAPIVAAAILIMGVGLFQVVPVMKPIKERSPAEFWLHVTGLDFGVKNPHRSFGDVYRPREGWFAYAMQGFHGQDLYRVRSADASALFPRVAERLRHAPPGLLNPDVERGFQEWKRSGAAPDDAAGFLDHVREARVARMEKFSSAYVEEVRTEAGFSERWERASRYHWNVIFEFVFLTGIILFAAWPWLRESGRVRWALHLGLLPTLFCLPYWLGYAPLTFTSAGPVGGVLYPWLLAALRSLPWTRLDTTIVRNLPQVLEPLSQTTGPMLSLSFFDGPGPVATTACGLLVALGVILAPKLVRALTSNRGQPHGPV